MSFQAGWPCEPAFTLDWLNNLTNDLEQAARPDAPITVAQLRRLLALSTSLAAVSRTCATGLHGIFAGGDSNEKHLQSLASDSFNLGVYNTFTAAENLEWLGSWVQRVKRALLG